MKSSNARPARRAGPPLVLWPKQLLDLKRFRCRRHPHLLRNQIQVWLDDGFVHLASKLPWIDAMDHGTYRRVTIDGTDYASREEYR